MNDLRKMAASVLLPATDASELSPELETFLRAGGRSILFGESREEYVARKMSDQRKARESTKSFRTLLDQVQLVAGQPVLVTIDLELGGIQRSEHLAPPLPTLAEARELSDAELSAACARTADAVRALGVGLVLGPVIDLIDGPQPWLGGRHLGSDPAEAARIATIVVRAFESAGVATCPKHFPGHRGLESDPAVDPIAIVPGDESAATADLEPFRAVADAGATAVMLGPATVPAFDPDRPALLSSTVVRVLNQQVGFSGLVVSDDLDSASVLADRSLEDATIEALVAGNDLLLVSAANDLPTLIELIAGATESGRVPAQRLIDASEKVSALAISRAAAA